MAANEKKDALKRELHRKYPDLRARIDDEPDYLKPEDAPGEGAPIAEEFQLSGTSAENWTAKSGAQMEDKLLL